MIYNILSAMTTPLDLIILCAGGHARVVIDILRRGSRGVSALVDADAGLHGSKLDDVPVIGDDAAVLARDPKTVVLVNALGNAAAQVGSSGLARRQALFEGFKSKGYQFAQVISGDAVVSATATLGEGCHVVTGAIIHPGCAVGANTIINTGAQLDHDVRVGAHCHVAPGAVLCGGVVVGDACHIGAGAVIVQGMTIGDGAVIGAGAVVIADVAAGATVVGNPARERMR
jgi:sugar O-acyltransferase (sialic acid O-acetyltransferase NeuD family)